MFWFNAANLRCRSDRPKFVNHFASGFYLKRVPMSNQSDFRPKGTGQVTLDQRVQDKVHLDQRVQDKVPLGQGAQDKVTLDQTVQDKEPLGQRVQDKVTLDQRVQNKVTLGQRVLRTQGSPEPENPYRVGGMSRRALQTFRAPEGRGIN